MAARSRSADGNETWLTRFFAAAMARRSKEAIRRASASTKPSSSASGSARLTYPYRLAVEIVRAENDFERPTATDQMWKTDKTVQTLLRHSDVPINVTVLQPCHQRRPYGCCWGNAWCDSQQRDRPKRTESGLIRRRGAESSPSQSCETKKQIWKPRVAADSQRTEGAQQRAATFFGMMVARDGVEPPTPAFSDSITLNH